jgi:hypothetical protein
MSRLGAPFVSRSRKNPTKSWAWCCGLQRGITSPVATLRAANRSSVRCESSCGCGARADRRRAARTGRARVLGSAIFRRRRTPPRWSDDRPGHTLADSDAAPLAQAYRSPEDARGGFIYRPTMSRTFSTNRGSGEILKERITWGLSPNVRQMRPTIVSDARFVGHGARTPLCRAHRCRFQRLHDHRLDCRVRDRPPGAHTRLVIQPLQPTRA